MFKSQIVYDHINVDFKCKECDELHNQLVDLDYYAISKGNEDCEILRLFMVKANQDKWKSHFSDGFSTYTILSAMS